MTMGKRWLFSFGNGAEIQPLEKGRKSPVCFYFYGFCSIYNGSPVVLDCIKFSQF